MDKKDWIRQLQQLAQDGATEEALTLFRQHQAEAVDMFFGKAACTADIQPDSLFERDVREIAQIVARWSIYALPLEEDVLAITVDMSQPGEPPLVTARTEGGEAFLFDVNEASHANEAHLEDCRHVEASWGDWQDEASFLPLFCEALTEALTQKGLPTPEFIR